ncbi:hypothetical protein [Alkalibacterium sp. 20]|uniref:hypothetical protein n=1 Tax=Alkalibacterium sp. 20 TaxID=1798803 RepID=UPI0008FFF4B4|nr:hypothetical protein [Alkalibacterium sp. 20]OJF92768.1 hypothetical protein AX762_09600 [Alkalibacterium sp. 20]
MKNRINHQKMDGLLKQLEDDYIKSVKENESSNVEAFIESFLYASWIYNEQHMEEITTVLSRYSKEEITKSTMSGAFSEMIDQLRLKLQQLDKEKEYPLLHSDHGSNLIVALVDGLMVQYFVGVYDVERLRELTPFLKKVTLNTLRTEVE